MFSLDKILKTTRKKVEEAKRRLPPDVLKKRLKDAAPIRSLQKALDFSSGLALIGEIKKASPSAGLIRKDFFPIELAKAYLEGGVTAISVLTEEEFFQGKLDYLLKIKKSVDLPLLRKDFIIDEYQILESRLFGADVVLLIASILNDEEINRFFHYSQKLGLEAIIEVHSEEEWERISSLPAKLIGVNNRNLKTLEVNLKVSLTLLPKITKGKTVISESGIKTREDVLNLERLGAKAILVGETIMGTEDIGKKIRNLLGK